MSALVVGASGYAGRHALRAFAGSRGVDADGDIEAAAEGAEVVVFCAPTWDPERKPLERRQPHPLLARTLAAAREAGARRFVHLSTTAVFGPDHHARIPESATPRARHAYERLKLREEEWLRLNRGQLELVVVRAAAGFGAEDPILGRLLRQLETGGLRLVNGGRAHHGFLAGPDLGRALAAAAARGRAGSTYVAAGFEGTWRELLAMASELMGVPARIGSIPYDIAYLLAAARWLRARPGEPCWPNLYGLDLLAKDHVYDDAHSRRDLSWSPQVGSFDEGVVDLVRWYRTVYPRPSVGPSPGVFSPLAGEVPPAVPEGEGSAVSAPATSQPGK
ncbi:MAG: NAD-dependent epimerase/dehydratase family protein [Chloroflexota bacterium]